MTQKTTLTRFTNVEGRVLQIMGFTNKLERSASHHTRQWNYQAHNETTNPKMHGIKVKLKSSDIY